MNDDIALLREHADRCRLLTQKMKHEHLIYMLSRMADECSEAADGMEADREAGRR